MKIEEKFKDMIKSIHLSSWMLLAVSFFVYSPFFVQQLNNADCNSNGYLYHYSGYGWENAQGRFFIRFFDMWRNRIVSPAIIIPISIILLVIAAELMIRVLDIKGVFAGLLAGAVIVLSPSFADLFSYYYTLDSYCLAFMLCALAAYLLVQKRCIKNCIIAGILMFISMGIYQVYAGFTLCLITVWLLKQCFDNKDKSIKEPLMTTLFSYITYAASTVAYLIAFKVLDLIGYLSPTKDRGADNIFGIFISGFLAKIGSSYTDLFRYFFTDDIIYNSWFMRKWINAAYVIVLLGVIVFLIVRRKIYSDLPRILTIALIILFLPEIIFLITILIPTSSVYVETGILLLPYINMVYVIGIALTDNTGSDTDIKHGYLIRIPTALICVILAVFIQVFAGYIDRQQVQISALANRLVYRMESLERYEQGQEVLVVGRPHRGNYALPDEKYETITKGMISHYSQIFGGEEQISDGWIKAFKYFVGTQYTECPADKRKELIRSDKVQNMGIYPASDSVQIIDDVVVIKLSEWDPK